MKPKYLLLPGLAAALIAVLLLRVSHKTSEPADLERTSAGGAQATPPRWAKRSAPLTPVAESVASFETAPKSEMMTTSASGAGPRQILIRGGQTLATVNGAPITLKDLIPISVDSSSKEQSFEPDRYGMLLNRAVERELAFQSAKAADVGLTEVQQQKLAKRRIPESQTGPDEFDNLGRSDANTEFEQRDAMGLMLLHNLAAAAGVLSPHVTTEQVRAWFSKRYPAAPDDSERSAEATVMDRATDAAIRTQLAPETKANYDEQFRQFVARLKAGAQISIVEPM